jgi:hypothetical protein
MSWAMIWAAIQGLLSGLNNVKKWKMSIDGKKNEPITAVKIAKAGMKFDFEVKGKEMTLEALPGDPEHAVIKVNGEEDEDARLVFSLKHQFLKPLIVVFEFKNITVDGETKRYRFDNPR